MKIIDISVSVDDKLPLWPGSSGLRLTRVSQIGKKSKVNETHIEINAHIGTHIDAQLHFMKKGKSIDESPLDIFIGPAVVVDMGSSKHIGVKELEGLSLPRKTKRILFKTSNSRLWKSARFKRGYVGVTTDGARWLASRGVRLVGIDYLSIAKFDESIAVHQILLGSDISILESINLSGVKPGQYELVSLPVKLSGAEAAPARAILLK